MSGVPVLPVGRPHIGDAEAQPDADGNVSADVVIVGSGMGGATAAYALRDTGMSVLVVERGDFLPREWENWSPQSVFADGRYRNAEQWQSAEDTRFDPGIYYYVGGNTKFYGAMLPRFREQDFSTVNHIGGVSPGWPVTYAALEPWYAKAEDIYRVHGTRNEDPTDPWRSGDYPFPALEHEPVIADLADSLRRSGLQPFSLPAAVDLRAGGACIRCRTCDGYPCMLDAKLDADVAAMRPALTGGSVRLLTRTYVKEVRTRDGKTVTELAATRDGRDIHVTGGQFILACGAVNTAALLLRSPGPRAGRTLANSSDQVGRNYMVHNSTFMVAVNPMRRNDTRFQKTLALNDWYLTGGPNGRPLGNVQMLGKLQGPMVSKARPRTPDSFLAWATHHSIDLYVTSEDLPDPNNRVTIGGGGRIVIGWTPNNLDAHAHLVTKARAAIRQSGYRFVATQRMGIETNSHMCGTVVMGDDGARSVVHPSGRTHDVDNLWIADSSVFPASAAVNPALTIAANALRVADNLARSS